MKETIAVIDGDILAFKSSAANENRSVEVTHEPSGRVKIFKHRTEFKQQVDVEKFGEDAFSIKDVQEAAGISFALHTVKKMIESICRACGTDKYEIYLSGNDNFRDKLPLPSKYKGSREGLMRPLQLSEVKKYLIKSHGAVTVKGEADDMISTRKYYGLQNGIKIIGCSTDKDDMGAEGWTYNWDSMNKPMLVQGLGELIVNDKNKVKGYGSKWKYFQWLAGDRIDGLNPTELAGIRFGEKSAYNLLSELTTEEECLKVVHDTYFKWYPEPVKYEDQNGIDRKMDYLDIAQMYWDGIHMHRWRDDFVCVQDLFKEYNII